MNCNFYITWTIAYNEIVLFVVDSYETITRLHYTVNLKFFYRNYYYTQPIKILSRIYQYYSIKS